jgi:hypothetical protein
MTVCHYSGEQAVRKKIREREIGDNESSSLYLARLGETTQTVVGDSVRLGV